MSSNHQEVAKNLADAMESLSLSIGPNDVAKRALMLNLDRALASFLWQQCSSNQALLEAVKRLKKGNVLLPIDLLERVVEALEAFALVFDMDGVDRTHLNTLEELRQHLLGIAS